MTMDSLNYLTPLHRTLEFNNINGVLGDPYTEELKEESDRYVLPLSSAGFKIYYSPSLIVTMPR